MQSLERAGDRRRLIGRGAETELVSSLIAGLGDGRPFVLTVRGEAGSGRSSLLAAAHDHADEAGARTLAARGVPGAAEPAFSALYSLFRPSRPSSTSWPPTWCRRCAARWRSAVRRRNRSTCGGACCAS